MRRQQAVLLKHQVGICSVKQTGSIPTVNYCLSYGGRGTFKISLLKLLGLISSQIFFCLVIYCFALVLGSFGGL